MNVTAESPAAIEVVAFDVGNVIVPWTRLDAFTAFEPDEARVAYLAEFVITEAVNGALDSGAPFAEVRERILAEHPEEHVAVDAWWEAWGESISPPAPSSLAFLDELRSAGYRCTAITNFSAETWARAIRLSWFAAAMERFEDIVISGVERVCKPDSEIFVRAMHRWKVGPEAVLFVDDSEPNVRAASALGIHAVHLAEMARLRETTLQTNLLVLR